MSLGSFNFVKMNVTVTSLAKIAALYNSACYKPCGDLKVIIGLQMALLISITDSKTTREIVCASLPHCSTRMIFDRFPYCTAFLQSVCLLERPKGTYWLFKNLCKIAKLLWALPPAVPSLLALFKKVQVSVHSEWNEPSCGFWEFMKTPTTCFIANVEPSMKFYPWRFFWG